MVGKWQGCRKDRAGAGVGVRLSAQVTRVSISLGSSCNPRMQDKEKEKHRKEGEKREGRGRGEGQQRCREVKQRTRREVECRTWSRPRDLELTQPRFAAGLQGIAFAPWKPQCPVWSWGWGGLWCGVYRMLAKASTLILLLEMLHNFSVLLSPQSWDQEWPRTTAVPEESGAGSGLSVYFPFHLSYSFPSVDSGKGPGGRGVRGSLANHGAWKRWCVF